MDNSLRNIKSDMYENWPEYAKTMSLSLLQMVNFQQLFKHEIQVFITRFGLQKADFGVLVTLRRSAKPYCLSPTELYKHMLFSSGGLTKVLTRLVDAGLIERLENEQDKRCKLVKLNYNGQQLIEEMMPQLHLQQKKLLEGLSEKEVLQLEGLLQKALDYHEKI